MNTFFQYRFFADGSSGMHKSHCVCNLIVTFTAILAFAAGKQLTPLLSNYLCKIRLSWARFANKCGYISYYSTILQLNCCRRMTKNVNSFNKLFSFSTVIHHRMFAVCLSNQNRRSWLIGNYNQRCRYSITVACNSSLERHGLLLWWWNRSKIWFYILYYKM